MAAKENLEAVRKLEARVLAWIIFAVAVIATPVVLIGVLSEVRVGRFDASLAALLAVHAISVALLLLVRAERPRAVVVVLYLLLAGCIVMMHYGPIISVGLFFLGAAVLARVYLGTRAAFIVVGGIALLVGAAALVYTCLGAPFYDPAADDPFRVANWIRMGITALALIVCILLLFGIINDGIATVALEAQAALERERREKGERLSAERALAESQRQEIVSRVAAGAAHDLNNVLTAVMGAADLAATYISDETGVRKELALISESVDRAAALTRQLLAFSRHQITQQKRVNLAEIVRSLEGLVQRLTPSNIEIAIEAARDLPLVQVDPAQIEQVILNLCVNARDAMPDGGRLTLRVFEASTGDGGPGVAVSVADTGSGITDEVRARMFDPFFTTKGEGRGTGLGLATVRIIVDAHGGEIRCESRVGEGTTMTVLLPRAETAGPLSIASQHPAAAAEISGRGESILFCDDDASIRTTGVRILERAGYKVQTAPDGAQALRIAASGSFALVVLDAVMPGGGGRQLYEALLADHPQLRFLFSTGYDPSVFGDRFFDDPRNHLLPKPYGRTELLRAVREVLDER
jgi:signal transduction histidine kinase/CheY-like chemotaxis protein